MKTPIPQLVIIGVLAGVAAGCTSAPSRFYTLTPTSEQTGTPHADYTVAVGPVNIPAEVDRPQFTVQVAPNRVAVDEFNRWAAPLSDNIARVVAEDLAALMGTPRVVTSQLANFNPTYRVSISVQRFESTPGKSAVVDAVWVVAKSSGGGFLSGRTVASEPTQGSDYQDLAAAHSRALARVSQDIAGALRAEGEKSP